MTTHPNSPRLLKGGIVLLDADNFAVQSVIALQYNPEKLTRTLQPQSVSEGGDRAEAQRLKGPPVETIKLDAELDATDQLAVAEPAAVRLGIHPQLAALEMIVYPPSPQIQNSNRLLQAGTLEIAPMLAPLTLFVWSKQRILPVRLTEFNIVEEEFDVQLNPIRAKVTLGMRVLNTNDLIPGNKGASLFMAYHQQKERLAAMNQNGGLGALGIGGLL